MNTQAEHQGGSCVPKIVEANPRQPCLLKEPTKRVVNVGRVQEAATPARKHKVVIIPKLPSCQPLTQLTCPMPAQGGDRGGRHLNRRRDLAVLGPVTLHPHPRARANDPTTFNQP